MNILIQNSKKRVQVSEIEECRSLCLEGLELNFDWKLWIISKQHVLCSWTYLDYVLCIQV